MKSLIKLSLFTLTAALLASCASSGYQKGNKAAENIQSAANRIGALSGTVDATLAALSDLVAQPQSDLRPQFKKFSALLADVESEGKAIADARRNMAGQGKAYFAQWDAELAQIQNEDIKARSAGRKEEVARKLQAIKRSYAETEVTAKPFIADLKDVQKFLSVDLTNGGIAAIKPTTTKAVQNSGPLKRSLAALAADFRALGVSMSSVTPQPAK